MSVLRPRTFLGRPLNLEEEEIGQDRPPPLSLPAMPTSSTTAKDAAGEKTKHFNLMILLQKLHVSPPNNSNVYFEKKVFLHQIIFRSGSSPRSERAFLFRPPDYHSMQRQQQQQQQNGNSPLSLASLLTETADGVELTKAQKFVMAAAVGGGQFLSNNSPQLKRKKIFKFSKGYMTWGTLFSVQPPFFPTEAEKKGATPSEVQFKIYHFPI